MIVFKPNLRISAAFVLLLAISIEFIEGKILTDVELAVELRLAGVDRSFFTNWICLAKHESGFNTRLMLGPSFKSSFSYGIFQISSLNGCIRGHRGGICKKKCEDFIASDDIKEDIACAVKIQKELGFKVWKQWERNCKGRKLPEIRWDRIRRDTMMTFNTDPEDIVALE